MFEFLRTKKETTSLLVLSFVYVALRIISLATYHSVLTNQIIAGIIIASFLYLCVKKPRLAFVILVAEFLLDGAGHFFELHGLLLRTWFLGIFGVTWLLSLLKEKKLLASFSALPRIFLFQILALSLVILFAILNGFSKNNTPIYILQDAILYLFVFLVFPAIEFYPEIKKHFSSIAQAFIVGSGIFSLFSFFYYSSGVGILRDTYYHWFRNVAGGKITDLGDNFFRIVLSEHLFIVPILLIITSLLIDNPKSKKFWLLLIPTSIVLVLNFSRIYFVALAVGMLVLAIKNSFKKWFVVSTLVTACVLGLFSSFYFAASRGNSLGLPLLGLRIGGTTSPSAETSGAIRLAILPKAIEKIKSHPWIGSGLGTAITYTDPTTKESVTRTQFDWGYHEVLAELGIVGTFIFLFFLVSLIFSLGKIIYISSPFSQDPNLPLLQGLFAGAISLFIINITTPALFQGFGILYFVLLLLIIQQSNQKLQSN